MKTQVRILVAVLGSLACFSLVNTVAASDQKASSGAIGKRVNVLRAIYSEPHLRSLDQPTPTWAARHSRGRLQFYRGPCG